MSGATWIASRPIHSSAAGEIYSRDVLEWPNPRTRPAQHRPEESWQGNDLTSRPIRWLEAESRLPLCRQLRGPRRALRSSMWSFVTVYRQRAAQVSWNRWAAFCSTCCGAETAPWPRGKVGFRLPAQQPVVRIKKASTMPTWAAPCCWVSRHLRDRSRQQKALSVVSALRPGPPCASHGVHGRSPTTSVAASTAEAGREEAGRRNPVLKPAPQAGAIPACG